MEPSIWEKAAVIMGGLSLLTSVVMPIIAYKWLDPKLQELQLGARHSVQFLRLYKPEGEEHWQSTTSFNRDDLPLVAKLADLAMMFIYESVQSEGT